MITTTTGGNVVSSHSESVSIAQRLVRRDTPSSNLSSTDEVACLMGSKEPNYARPVPLLPPLAPRPPPALGRIGRAAHPRHAFPKFRASHQRHSTL